MRPFSPDSKTLHGAEGSGLVSQNGGVLTVQQTQLVVALRMILVEEVCRNVRHAEGECVQRLDLQRAAYAHEVLAAGPETGEIVVLDPDILAA